MTDIQKIPFHEDELHAVVDERTGKQYVLPKRLCDIFKLSWPTQYAKLTKNQLFRKGISKITIPSGHGEQETLILEIGLVHAWLLSISPERVALEMREKLLRYQEECSKVLHDYFTKGIAVNPRTTTSWDVICQLAEAGRQQEQRINALEAAQMAQAQQLIEQQGTLILTLQRTADAHAQAALALKQQEWVTLRQYVFTNDLARQLPPGLQSTYGKWLAGYCLEHNIPVSRERVGDRPYEAENRYHVGTIEATLPGWLARREGQHALTLVDRPRAPQV